MAAGSCRQANFLKQAHGMMDVIALVGSVPERRRAFVNGEAGWQWGRWKWAACLMSSRSVFSASRCPVWAPEGRQAPERGA